MSIQNPDISMLSMSKDICNSGKLVRSFNKLLPTSISCTGEVKIVHNDPLDISTIVPIVRVKTTDLFSKLGYNFRSSLKGVMVSPSESTLSLKSLLILLSRSKCKLSLSYKKTSNKSIELFGLSVMINEGYDYDN